MNLELRLRSVGLAIAATSGVALAALALLDVWAPFPSDRLSRPAAREVRDRTGEPLRVFLASDETWRLPVALEDVSPELVRAVVASEDRYFAWHPGVNPLAIVRATIQNLRAGRIVSGASTLPMQIARMVERRPRTLTAKAIETFRALQLVWHFDRSELLEVYLNLAPFGGNIEGVGAAARFYLGKAPRSLSIAEVALLTALPRAPIAWDPTRHPEAARAARDRVLEQLVERGVFSADAARAARRQDVPRARKPVPRRAPHFARRVVALEPHARTLDTTIDARVQALAERLARSGVRDLRARGIGNVALVVIENDGRTLRAHVGSAAFFDRAHQGQVDAASAPRSPGSTLKPFLYGLAFDLGTLVPDSYVLDVPRDYSGYVPENYDGRYRGRVTARRALAESLNAPAVGLLSRVGLDRFLALLERGGVTSLNRPAGSYGLPLVLGAGEVTLSELTNLYATFADGGVFRRLRWRPGPVHPGTRLLSPDAVDRVLEILAEVKRPDLPEAWRLARDVPAIAWKTGTSYGHRDAWAVGVSERYTVGVWVGNPDGRGAPGLSGSDHAAPLLFDLFRSIERSASQLPRSGGAHVASVEVCALSHALPGPFCPHTEPIPIVAGRSRLGTCRHHQRIFLDDESGQRVTGECLARLAHHAKVVEVFPPELVAWWRARGQPVDPMPALHSECRTVARRAPPAIVSPSPVTRYRIRRDAPRDFQRVELAALTSPGTSRLYWYQDGRLLGSGRPDEVLFTSLQPGTHRLVVVDDGGRSATIDYDVD